MFGIASDTGIYLPTSECLMVAKVLHERERSIYLAKQLKVDPQCIDPKSAVLMEDSKGRSPEARQRENELQQKRRNETDQNLPFKEKKLHLMRTTQPGTARKERQ